MGGLSSHHNAGVDVEDGRAFADELSRVDNTEPVHANLIHSLSRHIAGVSAPFAGHMRARANSGAASTKAASVATGISNFRDKDREDVGTGPEDEAGFATGPGTGGDGPKTKKAKSLGKKLLGRGG